MTTKVNYARRGSALAIAMMFMVLITISGASLLSMSSLQQQTMIRSTWDSQLIVAAEAGVATRRGRFALVPGVQGSWSALLPSAGWHNVGEAMTINGITVNVQAMRTGPQSQLQARIRGVATGWGRSQVVEYTIRTNSFATHALLSEGRMQISGAGVQVVGSMHSNQEVSIPAAHWSVSQGISASGSIQTNHHGSVGAGFAETPNAPKIELPEMMNLVPTPSQATVIMTGNRNINNYSGVNPNANGWTIVWVKNGSLDIRGTVTNKVWFVVDKDVDIKGDLKPADQNSAIRIYSSKEISASGANIEMNGWFMSGEGLKFSGARLDLKGIYWTASDVQISGADTDVRGAVMAEGEIKISGARPMIQYDSTYSISYGEPKMVPGSWANHSIN